MPKWEILAKITIPFKENVMRVSTKFMLPLTPVLLGLLFVPHAALAGVANCPIEPAANVPITSGDVFAGTNCVLSTPGDVDSFRFSATSGDIYQLVAVMASSGYPQNICLQLLDPTSTQIFYGCSNSFAGVASVVAVQQLTVSGLYTMVVTEVETGTLSYGTSLERLHPVPPDAQQLTLGTAVSGQIPLADSPAFTFEGLTTGNYGASATMTGGSGYPANLCIVAYFPNGTTAGSGCTNSFAGVLTVKINFTPPQNGAVLVLVYEAGYNLTTSYTMTVSCLSGKCGSGYPPCTLTDKLQYDAASGTLMMNFTVGTNSAATWNAWLTYQNSMVPLFSVSQQKTVPPVPIPQEYPLAAEGVVGVLSTLTTPTKGISCSSWVQTNTGTAP
ncbi:MAG TPA: hypothetical protein VMT86_18475 [Bryobacteraceae bacterium]|nr:hypothetical protein [Bryobacteraceae bacterium]